MPEPDSTPDDRLPTGPRGRGRHPQVAVAAFTFCAGLLSVRIILGLFGLPKFHLPDISLSDPLVQLQLVAAAVTTFYLIMRREEGDFSALVLATLGLFVSEELLGYLSGPLGLAAFAQLAGLLPFTLAIYASLALSAAAYDTQEEPPPPWKQRRPLATAMLGMLALSLIRITGTVWAAWVRADLASSQRIHQRAEWVAVALLAALSIYLLCLQWMESRAVALAQAQALAVLEREREKAQLEQEREKERERLRAARLLPPPKAPAVPLNPLENRSAEGPI